MLIKFFFIFTSFCFFLLIKFFIVLNFTSFVQKRKENIFFLLEYHFIHFWPRKTSVYYLSISNFFFSLQIYFVLFQTRAVQLHCFLRWIRAVIFFYYESFANLMRFSFHFKNFSRQIILVCIIIANISLALAIKRCFYVNPQVISLLLFFVVGDNLLPAINRS